MIRARFNANPDDYRPVKWPPVGPYWCTGYSGDDRYSVVVAYLERADQIFEFWPEAVNVGIEERAEITFTDRFQCPDWWDPARNRVKTYGE